MINVEISETNPEIRDERLLLAENKNWKFYTGKFFCTANILENGDSYYLLPNINHSLLKYSNNNDDEVTVRYTVFFLVRWGEVVSVNTFGF